MTRLLVLLFGFAFLSANALTGQAEEDVASPLNAPQAQSTPAATLPFQDKLAEQRTSPSSPDALLIDSLHNITQGKLDDALKSIDKLVSLQPDFKLAHLVRGDLLMARARPLQALGPNTPMPEKNLTDLRDEARYRMLSHLDQPAPNLLPRQLLQMAPDQRYALLADASRARLYVFENTEGAPRLIRDFYMTLGRNGIEKQVEGDKRTPMGVYTISDQIPRSRLTDFYGAGAFPLNYPNEWDQTLGRTGHGIWLHGVPSDTYSRPPRASDGCVVVTNPDFSDIAQYIQVGITPVLIVDRTDWVDLATWEAQRKALLDKIESWRADWENRQPDAFLSHYSTRFLDGEGKSWAESKRRNIGNKDWIKLELSAMGIYLYPTGDLAVITFRQDYDSNTYRSSAFKKLYLTLENGQWQIALEKTLQPPNVVASRAQ